MSLLKSFFDQFSNSSAKEIWIPSFDKSLFHGEGDRLPRSEWKIVDCHRPIDIVIFEGWCIGFQHLPKIEVERKRTEALQLRNLDQMAPEKSVSDCLESRFSVTTLADHELANLLLVNECLENYCTEFMGPQHFDFMVHLDTDNLVNVYTWRIQQEHALRRTKGAGMEDEKVIEFGTDWLNLLIFGG